MTQLEIKETIDRNNKIIKDSENLNGKGREDLGRSPRRIQGFELV